MKIDGTAAMTLDVARITKPQDPVSVIKDMIRQTEAITTKPRFVEGLGTMVDVRV